MDFDDSLEDEHERWRVMNEKIKPLLLWLTDNNIDFILETWNNLEGKSVYIDDADVDIEFFVAGRINFKKKGESQEDG